MPASPEPRRPGRTPRTAALGPAVLRGGCAVALVWAAVVLAQHFPAPWPVALAVAVLAAALAATLGARGRHAPDAAAPDAPAPSALPAPAAAPDAPALPETESLAFTVSHDLRAPIRVIEGFTRIVREDYGHLLDRVGNDHLERVLGAAARMNQMIDSLLALARLSTQPLVRAPVDLSQLAAQVVEGLRAKEPQRRCEVRIAPGLRAQGDAASLQALMDNLLGNAWKYTARRELAQIDFGQAEVGGRRAYFVRDNGAGFDMRFAARLFGPFQRLHSASEFQGTGVGLASVQRIVRRHGGEVWADAAVERGATFYFTLGEA